MVGVWWLGEDWFFARAFILGWGFGGRIIEMSTLWGGIDASLGEFLGVFIALGTGRGVHHCFDDDSHGCAGDIDLGINSGAIWW